MLRAITLDVAGTLIEPTPSVGAIYAEVARSNGFSGDATHLNLAFPGALKRIREKWSVPFGSHEEDARRFWFAVIDETFSEPLPYDIGCELYDTFSKAKRWRVLPQVREALTIIKDSGLPVAIVSNFDNRLKPLLQELEMGPFAAIITSSSIGHAKPDPKVLLAACKAMKVAPTDVLHIGDCENEDGAMCKKAGAQWLQSGPEGIPLAELESMLHGRVA